MTLSIRPATEADVPTVALLIRALSRYEKLEHEVTMTEEKLRTSMFGPRPYAEAVIAEDAGEAVGAGEAGSSRADSQKILVKQWLIELS